MSGWHAFVERHQDPVNHRIHFLSMVVFIVGLANLVLAALDGRFAWGWFLIWWSAGPIGTLGHWWTGDGTVSTREATADPFVPFYVVRMFWELGRGTYGEHIAAAQTEARKAS